MASPDNEPKEVEIPTNPAESSIDSSALTSSEPGDWLDIPRLARVELGSEEAPANLVESALSIGLGQTWRAKDPGAQTIRISFHVPLTVRRIRLAFVEEETERTQEFLLRWLQEGGTAYRDIVRQQYNFSPSGSNREIEEYQVELRNLAAIELHLIPNLHDRNAFMSLTQWSLSASPVQNSDRCH